MKPLGSWPGKKNKPKEPLRTLNELAAALGLEVYQLIGHFSKSPINTPKPVSEFCGNMTRKNKVRYYSPTEFKKWWVEYNKVINVRRVNHG